MPALSVLTFSSIGQGLVAANMAGQAGGLEIIECTAQGEQSLLLIDGPVGELDQFHHRALALKPTQQRFFSDLDSRVLECHFSLTNSEIQSDLFVLESRFLGDLFCAVEKFFVAGAACVDLRAARGTNRLSYALMTANSGLDFKEMNLPQGLTVTHVAQVNQSLRDFLDLRPNKA